MKLTSLHKIVFPCLIAAGITQSASAAHIWINEFHYDNAGADADEFVEVAISNPNGSGFTFADYAIQRYNGSDGGVTGELVSLTNASGPFTVAGTMDTTITLYTLFISGIQNGAPDGIALVNTTNSTVESFLSYEGSFIATDGIAMGETSIDVGVSEDGDTLGTSLSAAGMGSSADEFDAGSFTLATTATPGAVNQGQTFTADAIPEPSAAILGALGLLGLLRRRR